MKAQITFEKFARYFGYYGEEPILYVKIIFYECSYEEFYKWLDYNKERFGRVHDIGYSDKVIIFSNQ